MNFTVLKFDSIDSTNTEALNQARRGADEGLCVTARRQTAGRGRHGRAWSSPAGAGLYFSVVLRPQLETRFLPLLTLMSAVAVHDAIETLYPIECDIKWANDIHVKDKKICGILAETAETTKGLAVVVGIGVNLRAGNFPAELAETATSIETETGRAPDADKLLPALTEILGRSYDVLQTEGGAEKIRRAWEERSSYFAGKEVKVMLAGETLYGTTRGLEENGALRVETREGAIRIVHAGDVEKVRSEK